MIATKLEWKAVGWEGAKESEMSYMAYCPYDEWTEFFLVRCDTHGNWQWDCVMPNMKEFMAECPCPYDDTNAVVNWLYKGPEQESPITLFATKELAMLDCQRAADENLEIIKFYADAETDSSDNDLNF